MVEFSQISDSQLREISQRFPWFTAARVKLCINAMSSSGKDIADCMFEDSLLWLHDPDFIAKRLHSTVGKDFSDSEMASAIREALSQKPIIYMAGMDYFSQQEYDSVTRPDDSSISKIAVVDYDAPLSQTETSVDFDPISETLAEIFIEQGYPDKAIEVYRKLSLQSPEKSAYFASQIEKLNN